MKLKASVDYGVRAVLYLAVKGDTCSSREISEEMAVPRDYLIQLALRLRNYGLIKARPGKNGGYVLARPASEITVADILNAFDSDLKHVRQPMKTGRGATPNAATVKELHGMVVESLNCYLEAITIQDLMDSMNADEKAAILSSDVPEEKFAALWTCKEAVFKMQGTGITDNLHHILSGGVTTGTKINHEKGYALSVAW